MAELLPFIYAFAFCQPQGDDFDFITRAMFLFDLPGALYEMGREWLTWSGRYSAHFFFVFFGSAPASQFVNGALCLILASLFAVGGIILGKSVKMKAPFFFGALCLLCLFASHSSLWLFYLYTDALTSGLQGTLFFIFLALLCKMVINPEESRTKKMCILTAIIAIGLYENAAMAVLWTIALTLVLVTRLYKIPIFSTTPFFFKNPAIKPLAQIFIIVVLAVLFSWLAPGNMQRASQRGIEFSQKMTQLALAPEAWWKTICFFFSTPWPLTATCLGVFAALQAKNFKMHRPFLLLFVVLFGFLCFSLSMAFLLALTDTPLDSTKKHIVNISVYAAIAWGFIIFCFCHNFFGRHLSKAPIVWPQWLILSIFFAVVLTTQNFRATAINAVNGEFIAFNSFMQERKAALQTMAATVPTSSRWPAFGLRGELQTGSASRKPKIKSDLPNVALDAWLHPTYPVYSHEAHPANPVNWPNLWAAWSYGVGSISATLPAPQKAINQIHAGTALELTPTGPVAAAWLVDAQGNLGANLSWLGVKFKEPVQKIWILHPNPVSWLRLAPVFCQESLLKNLLGQKIIDLDLTANLAASLMSFSQLQLFLHDNLYILPIGLAQAYPKVIFISMDGRAFYRLNPFL